VGIAVYLGIGPPEGEKVHFGLSFKVVYLPGRQMLSLKAEAAGEFVVYLFTADGRDAAARYQVVTGFVKVGGRYILHIRSLF